MDKPLAHIEKITNSLALNVNSTQRSSGYKETFLKTIYILLPSNPYPRYINIDKIR